MLSPNCLSFSIIPSSENKTLVDSDKGTSGWLCSQPELKKGTISKRCVFFHLALFLYALPAAVLHANARLA